MTVIASRANPLVKRLAALHDAKARRAERLTLAEGVHLVRDALAAGVDARWLVLAEDALDREEIAPLAEAAARDGIEVLTLSRACYGKISGLNAPEGVALVPRLDESGNLTTHGGGSGPATTADAKLLVAVGVQDPGNAGALARVAEAAGATACHFAGGVDPVGPRFLRAAMGSAFRLPCHAEAPGVLLGRLKAEGVRLLVAAPPGRLASGVASLAYDAAEYAVPVALCVGSEGLGLPAEWLSAGTPVYIPMAGAVESLNVAVAAGIWLYEARRAWQAERTR